MRTIKHIEISNGLSALSLYNVRKENVAQHINHWFFYVTPTRGAHQLMSFPTIELYPTIISTGF